MPRHFLATCLSLAVTAIFFGVVWPASGTIRTQRAAIARTQNVTDTADLKSVKTPGSLILEEGTARGGLPGKVKVWLDVGPTITASFTITAHGGSISGHGSGTLRGTGKLASFGGTMSISHGTGRFAHARGHGGFYGTIERKPPYNAVVQTTGNVSD